jgi:hypothetical protein
MSVSQNPAPFKTLKEIADMVSTSTRNSIESTSTANQTVFQNNQLIYGLIIGGFVVFFFSLCICCCYCQYTVCNTVDNRTNNINEQNNAIVNLNTGIEDLQNISSF